MLSIYIFKQHGSRACRACIYKIALFFKNNEFCHYWVKNLIVILSFLVCSRKTWKEKCNPAMHLHSWKYRTTKQRWNYTEPGNSDEPYYRSDIQNEWLPSYEAASPQLLLSSGLHTDKGISFPPPLSYLNRKRHIFLPPLHLLPLSSIHPVFVRNREEIFQISKLFGKAATKNFAWSSY